jgi:tetratricopeptide (TPR) repeat protein
MIRNRYGSVFLAAWIACALAAPGALGAEDPVREAAALHRAGRVEEARALLEARIAEVPDDIEAHLAYVHLRGAAGEREAVRQEYERLVLKDPSNPAVRLARVVLLGRSQLKSKGFDDLLAENPGFARAWEEYGRSLLEGFQFLAAEEALRRAVELDPERAMARLYLGLVHRARARAGEEEAEMREAHRLDPGSLPVRLELGTTLAYAGHLAEAKGVLEELLRETPEDAEALAMLALVEERLGRKEEAARLRERVHAIDPRLPGKLLYLGIQHRSVPEKQAAKRFLELSIFLDSVHVEAFVQLGLIYRMENDPAGAIPYYEVAGRLDEKNQLAWRNLGMCYRDLGDGEKAELYVRRAVEVDPDYLHGWIDYANILHQRGKYAEAMEAWKRVNEMAPYGWEGYEARRAISYLERGEPVPVQEPQTWRTEEVGGVIQKKSGEPPARPTDGTK